MKWTYKWQSLELEKLKNFTLGRFYIGSDHVILKEFQV